MWVAFAVQKLLKFFSAKNIRKLYIESTKTVNEMTLNELVKLTMLWTTGPRLVSLLPEAWVALKLSVHESHHSRSLKQNSSQALIRQHGFMDWAGPSLLASCSLTLVMLNKLRCHVHFQFSANQIIFSRFLIEIHIFNDKKCRSRSVGFFKSQLIWKYTVC